MIPSHQFNILPISFPVTVAGIQQQATVLEDASDIEAFKYKVRFEDGYEDIFTVVEGPRVYIQASEPKRENYSSSILADLYILTTIEPDLFFYVLPMRFNREPLNVWLIETEPASGEIECLGIFYHQRLQFEMYLASAEDGWRYRSVRSPLTDREQQLAEELTATLETMRSALKL